MFNNFNNLNLTWKINLIIALIILLIISVIAYVIFNYATDILLNEAGEDAPLRLKENITNSGLAVSKDLKEFRRLGRIPMIYSIGKIKKVNYFG